MKRNNPGVRLLIHFLILLMALPAGGLAQDTAENQEAPEFSKEELAQMLAPIALYPDSLLAQILMASTYPLEVVQAARWIEKQPDLKGDQLDAALKEQEWDVSVKAMTHFPDILKKMNERVEETSRLGDAFLAQEGDVMDMVQELRSKAKAEGNLETTTEQKVIVEEKVIIIEPAKPEVIYVPTYSPTVVYGAWWYPAYPPYRPYYPYYPGGRAVAFTAGLFVGAALTSWCRFGWHNRSVNVNINRTANFNRNVNRGGGNQKWNHNPKHRKGVPYKDKRTSKRYGQSPSRSKDARRDARGYDRGKAGTMDRKGSGGADRGKAGSMDRQRPSGADRSKAGTMDRKGSGGANRGKAGTMDRKKSGGADRGKAGTMDRKGSGGTDRSKSGSMNRQGSGSSVKKRSGSGSRGGSSAFSGGGSRSSSSRASSRGQASRRSGGGGGGRRR